MSLDYTLRHLDVAPLEPSDATLHVGYLARLAPEKGLHVLVDAFLQLQQMPGLPPTRLLVAGWLGKRHHDYAHREFNKLKESGLSHAFEYRGVVNRIEKLQLLSQLDLFCVPTTYGEAKGLYVLEALAAGAPVVQPDHGAFPELLAATGGGHLITPNDPQALAEAIFFLLTNSQLRQQLGRAGQQSVHDVSTRWLWPNKPLPCGKISWRVSQPSAPEPLRTSRHN